MLKLPLVLAILMVGGLATTSVALETRRDPAQGVQATQDPLRPVDASTTSADLRLGLAFWLPVYYGIYVWLLSSNDAGGGSKHRANDRGSHRAAFATLQVNGLVPARAPRPVGIAPLPRKNRRS
jgi:hypothetical protein